MKFRRFPVAARLAITLAALSGMTLALAALVDDRVLARRLMFAAEEHLDVSAHAADRLVAGHLSRVLERTLAVSRTPELRAQIEISHRATLSAMAAELARSHGARLVLFRDGEGKPVAGHGDAEFARATLGAWAGILAQPEAQSCIAPLIRDKDGLASSHTARFVTCQGVGSGRSAATLIAVADGLHATALLPLFTGDRYVGSLLVVEPINASLLAFWSELVGAKLAIGPVPDAEALLRVARNLPGVELVVTSSLDSEQAALLDAWRNRALAALVAVALAIALSVVLARSFVRPIREIQAATERAGRGDLEVRLESQRRDEIGDVARSFDATLHRLRYSQQRLRNVQRIARFGDWSLVGGEIDGAPEFRRVLDLPEGPVSLERFLDCFSPGERARLRRGFGRCERPRGAFDLDLRLAEPDERQEPRIVQVRARHVEGLDGAQVEGSVQDVTDRRRSEEQIRYLAYHDPLTGLANRRCFSELLELAMMPDSSEFAVVFCDLDRFKIINDTLGHSAGDELLREVAQRLRSLLPEGRESSAARFGGDEFTLLVADPGDHQSLQEFTRKLQKTLSEPITAAGQELAVSASVGVARWPQDGNSVEDLFRCCDAALQRAKAEGQESIRFYDESMKDADAKRFQLENRLRGAVERTEFQLYYQPRVSASTGRIVSFEALLRWNDPKLGPCSPSEFIPLAEDAGLIVPLGAWALRTAVAQLREWVEAGISIGGLSVNLSGRQLSDDLVQDVAALLEESGVRPGMLELEVTESSVIQDAKAGVEVLSRLRDMGVRIALDDFGTGYSSLSYLRTLPIDAVKIDRSFVEPIVHDEEAAALTAAIVSMAEVLGLEVIAEGVETEEQRDLLVEMGCDELQGFLFGEASPADVSERRMRERPKRRRRSLPSRFPISEE